VGDQRADVREGLAAKLAEDDAGGRVRVGREFKVHRLDRTRGGIVGLRRQVHAGLEAQLCLQLQVGRLLAVLERLEAVREDVPRQLALVEERGTAVHARKHPLIHTHQLLQPNKQEHQLLVFPPALCYPRGKDSSPTLSLFSLSFFSLSLSRSRSLSLTLSFSLYFYLF